MNPLDTPPVHLGLSGAGLTIQWDESQSHLGTQQLRTQCRCAHCKQLALQGTPAQAVPDLQLVNASPVGSYGVQLHFSDGHARGIYPWSYLRTLATQV